MSVLSRDTVKRRIELGDIGITPYELIRLEATCYSLTLGDRFRRINTTAVIDPAALPEDLYEEGTISPDGIVIPPGDFVILFTAERLWLASDLFGLLATTPSLARLGLDVTQTSTHMPPGSNACLALETTNRGPAPLRLRPGQTVAKIVFMPVR